MEYKIPINPIEALFPYQAECFEKLCAILEKMPAAINCSETGTGKTKVSLAIAEKYQYGQILVICPNSVKHKWKDESKYHGIPTAKITKIVGRGKEKIIDGILNYEALRSCNHNLIKRTEPLPPTLGKDKKLKHKYHYEPTPYLIELIEEGTLFIFDENHRVKNASAQVTKVAAIISTAIATRETRSRIILNSRTPLDKLGKLDDSEKKNGKTSNSPKQIIAIMTMLGIINGLLFKSNPFATLSMYGKDRMIPVGITDVIRSCYNINAEDTVVTIHKLHPLDVTSKDDIDEICKDINRVYANKVAAKYHNLVNKLLINVVRKHLTVRMTDQTGEKFGARRCGFFNVDEKNAERMSESLHMLDKLLAQLRNKKITKKEVFEALGSQLPIMECCKIDSILRLAEKDLSTTKNDKVVIFLNYVRCRDEIHKCRNGSHNHLLFIKEALEKYNPAIYFGDMSLDSRNQQIDRFRDDNDCRVFIATLGSCSEGVDLHDIFGDQKRHSYISGSTYKIIDEDQAAGRTQRHGSKSIHQVYLVYLKHHLFQITEHGIINAIMTKTEALNTITNRKDSNDGIPFPGDYPTYTEDMNGNMVLEEQKPLEKNKPSSPKLKH